MYTQKFYLLFVYAFFSGFFIMGNLRVGREGFGAASNNFPEELVAKKVSENKLHNNSNPLLVLLSASNVCQELMKKLDPKSRFAVSVSCFALKKCVGASCVQVFHLDFFNRFLPNKSIEGQVKALDGDLDFVSTRKRLIEMEISSYKLIRQVNLSLFKYASVLRWLTLSHCSIPNLHFVLEGLPNLIGFITKNCSFRVSNGSLLNLLGVNAQPNQLPKLKSLRLSSSAIVNLSAEDLQFFSLLESLVLKRVRLDVKTLCDGINPLNKLKKLWFFDSEFNSVSLGSDVKFGFSVLTKLSSLAFNGYHSSIPFPVDEIFGLAHIQRLNLTNISGFNLSSVANEHLSALKRLRCLDIQGTEFDSSSVEALQNLPDLRFLKVGNVDEVGQQTVFDGQVLLGLSALTALRALRIQNLPDLNNLQIHSLLSRLVNLESLSLCQLPSISNAGLRALAHMPKLHSVFLDVVEMVTPWFVRNFDNPTLIRRFLRDVSVSVGDMLSFSPQACGNVLQKHGVISTKFGPQEDEQRLPENAMVNGLSSDPVVEVSRYQKLLLPSADWYQPLSA